MKPLYGDTEEPVDVVALGAHPDDVEIFAGGTVAGMVRRGYRVAIVDLTAGEAASAGDVPTRAAEAARAAEVLGVAARVCLGLPDAGLIPGREEQALPVVRTLRHFRPRLVLGPWGEERHPDHVAAHALVRRAVFLAGLGAFDQGTSPHRVHECLWYLQRVASPFDLLVDISDDLEAKRAAMRAHASQIGSHRGPGEAPLIGSDDAMDALETKDRWYGTMAGTRAAEPWRTTGAVVIDDPVATFALPRRRHMFPTGRS